MNKLLFVINPISGGIEKTNLRNDIEVFCKENRIIYDIHETTGEDDVNKVSHSVDHFHASTVVACGGDGTINMVAQAVISKNIKIAILPLGSANGLATELLIPNNLQRALEVILSGKTIDMDVVRINKDHISLHLSDVGFNAKLIKYFEDSGTRGKVSYAAHFFKVLFKPSAHRYKCICNGSQFRRKAEMVVFANASKYGTGAVVNPEGSLTDGQFEVCVFKRHPWYGVFRIAFDFFTGRLHNSPYVKIFSTKRIEVFVDTPVTLQVDGEVIDDFDHILAELDENKLSVIVPEEYEEKKPPRQAG